MAALRPVQPVRTAHLFRPLHRELIALLRGLDAPAWELPTAAGSWNVRQVAAHLFHGDLRKLSAPRLEGPRDAGDMGGISFAELVALIDADNARGVEFLSTLSPRVITDLLEFSGRPVARLFASLAPDALASTNVAWAGEAVSANWTDVGREFTERFHHQMHIRDAVGAPALADRRFVEPILRLSVLALRRSFGHVAAEPGTSVVLHVTGSWRHSWSVVRATQGWDLFDGAAAMPAATVTMDAEVAWRSLYDFFTAIEARKRATIEGDPTLGEPILAARSVMIANATNGAG